MYVGPITLAPVACVRFLPTGCPEHCPVLLDEDGKVRENPVKKDMTRRLDFSAWLLSWDPYAIGAIALYAVERVCSVLCASLCNTWPNDLQVSNEA